MSTHNSLFSRSRRLSLLGLLASPLAYLAGQPLLAQTAGPGTAVLATTGAKGRVVIVGGGMAGTTAAKYLRLWGGNQLEVFLVEPRAAYVSNIMSTAVLNRTRSLATLAFGYQELVRRYGVQLIQDRCVAIEKDASRVTLETGRTLSYDRLIIAPGVEFMPAWGLMPQDYETAFPHAWEAGSQTQALASQVAAVRDGEVFVLVIPKAPFRCPPGPYERACVIADEFRRTGRTSSKVVVLDENPVIQAKAETFERAFFQTHAGTIDYRPAVVGLNIDRATKGVRFTDQLGQQTQLRAAVISPIAPHRARGSAPGGLLDIAGINSSADRRWCPVNLLTYESLAAPRIHVLGDAASTGMPKAGHVANQEAKICADAIIRSLLGEAPDPSPVANSACYSSITASSASWLTVVYQFDPAKKVMVPAGPLGSLIGGRAIESSQISSSNHRDMQIWFETLMKDSFS